MRRRANRRTGSATLAARASNRARISGVAGVTPHYVRPPVETFSCITGTPTRSGKQHLQTCPTPPRGRLSGSWVTPLSACSPCIQPSGAQVNRWRRHVGFRAAYSVVAVVAVVAMVWFRGVDKLGDDNCSPRPRLTLSTPCQWTPTLPGPWWGPSPHRHAGGRQRPNNRPADRVPVVERHPARSA